MNTHTPTTPVGELLHTLETDGYLLFPEFVPAQRCNEIRTALSPWLQGELPGRNNFEGHKSERVYALLEKSPVFADMVAEPLILALCEQVLGANFLLSACLAINTHPGETPQPWHTDDGFYRVPRPRPAYGLSAFWIIDEFTEHNGATEILPGSHLWGDSATDGERQPDSNFPPMPENGDNHEPVPVVAPAGSLLIALGTVWHRGGANNSEHPRLLITPQYCVSWGRQLESMLLSVSPERAAQYPKRVRELLGYNIHPPFIGYIDGLHPERRLPGWPDLPS